MGQKIDDPPVEYGNDCPSCTPARWSAGDTPKYVYCMFWGISNCGVSPHDAPNGEVFRMVQEAGNDCGWRLNGSVWKPDWTPRRIGGPQSQLRLSDHHGFSFFTSISLQCPFEYWTYSNAQGSCILAYAGGGGWGTVWWNEDVTRLIEQFGLTPGDDLFYEIFRSPGAYYIHKFCDLYQRTNLKIKLSIV